MQIRGPQPDRAWYLKFKKLQALSVIEDFRRPAGGIYLCSRYEEIDLRIDGFLATGTA